MAVSYLLDGGVADGVRVVMVVDDLEVSHGFAFRRSGEVDLGFGFAGSLRVNGEVGGLSHLHTCTGERKPHQDTSAPATQHHSDPLCCCPDVYVVFGLFHSQHVSVGHIWIET